MRLTVEYLDGVYSFRVESLEPDNQYVEEFELMDTSEAKEAAWEIISDLADQADDLDGDDFAGLFDKDDLE
jgi:hypothetical protein